MRYNLCMLLLLFVNFSMAQEATTPSNKNLGIYYFGELGLRPGLEIDYGLPLWNKESMKENKKRGASHSLHLRPSAAYYFYSNNSNNFLFASKLNYQLRFVKASNSKYFFLEPFIKIGYLRKSLIGEKFQLSDDGFESVKRAGVNSLVAGSGLDFGGYVSAGVDWLFGFDYFIERTQDKLILHRFAVKLGLRKKLNK